MTAGVMIALAVIVWCGVVGLWLSRDSYRRAREEYDAAARDRTEAFCQRDLGAVRRAEARMMTAMAKMRSLGQGEGGDG